VFIYLFQYLQMTFLTHCSITWPSIKEMWVGYTMNENPIGQAHSSALLPVFHKLLLNFAHDWFVHVASIKLLHIQNTPLARSLLARGYINDRRPGNMTFADKSKRKIGRQDLPNRLGMQRQIKQDWCNRNFNNDALRILLKKTFFKHSSWF